MKELAKTAIASVVLFACSTAMVVAADDTEQQTPPPVTKHHKAHKNSGKTATHKHTAHSKKTKSSQMPPAMPE